MIKQKKTAAFLADCLSNIPPQPEQVQSVVNTMIEGLKRIADGSGWPAYQADAATWAAWDVAADAAASAAASAEAWAAASAAAWASNWAVDRAADRSARSADRSARSVDRAAAWAARAHPDPDAERARQAKVREKLGL